MKTARAVLFALLVTTAAFAQDAANNASTPASTADVEALRQQVQSLTELVKQLQEQVKQQQGATPETAAAGAPVLPQNPEPQQSAAPAAASAATTAPQLIPTEDASVVANAPAPPPSAA